MKIITFKQISFPGAVFGILVLIQCNTASFSEFEVEINNGKKSNNVIQVQESSGSDGHAMSKRALQPINQINRKQIRTNKIGTGLDVKPYNRKQLIKWARYLAKHGELRRGFRVKRTVESPAMSTDTGGRPSQAGISGGISRLFGSNKGHYSDAYDKIDYKKNLTTHKPSEPSETILRVDIQNAQGESLNNNVN